MADNNYFSMHLIFAFVHIVTGYSRRGVPLLRLLPMLNIQLLISGLFCAV